MAVDKPGAGNSGQSDASIVGPLAKHLGLNHRQLSDPNYYLKQAERYFAESPKARRTLRIWRFITAVSTALIAVVAYNIYTSFRLLPALNYGPASEKITSTILLVIVASGPMILLFFAEDRLRQRYVDEYLTSITSKEVGCDPRTPEPRVGDTEFPADSPEVDQLSLQYLSEVNRSQIARYHAIVLQYATRTRKLTVRTLTAGFLAILVVASVATFTSNGAASISVGVIGAATAGLTGYVSRVLMRNAEHSASEMRAFFQHPLTMEKVLSAERITESMDAGDRLTGQLKIIDFLTSNRNDPDVAAPGGRGGS